MTRNITFTIVHRKTQRKTCKKRSLCVTPAISAVKRYFKLWASSTKCSASRYEFELKPPCVFKFNNNRVISSGTADVKSHLKKIFDVGIYIYAYAAIIFTCLLNKNEVQVNKHFFYGCIINKLPTMKKRDGIFSIKILLDR